MKRTNNDGADVPINYSRHKGVSQWSFAGELCKEIMTLISNSSLDTQARSTGLREIRKSATARHTGSIHYSSRSILAHFPAYAQLGNVLDTLTVLLRDLQLVSGPLGWPFSMMKVAISGSSLLCEQASLKLWSMPHSSQFGHKTCPQILGYPNFRVLEQLVLLYG